MVRDSADILEKPHNAAADLSALPRHPLTRTVELFLSKFLGQRRNQGQTQTLSQGKASPPQYSGPGPVVAVSLSGGVDSMVLAKILVYLRDRDDAASYPWRLLSIVQISTPFH